MKIRNLIVVASVSIVLSACSNMPKLPDLSALGKLLPPAGGASGGGGFFSSGAKSPNGVDLDSVIKKYRSILSDLNEPRKDALSSAYDLPVPWQQQVTDELGKPSRSDLFELKHKDKLSSTVLTGRRSVLYYDTPEATYVFVFKVYGHSEEGLELYDRFKKPMVNYVYPKNRDLTDSTQAPEMSEIKVGKVK